VTDKTVWTDAEVNSNWYLTACYVAVVDEYEDDSENEQGLWSQLTSEDVDIDLKVIVPTGYVIAVDRVNPSRVLWQQKVC